MRYYSVCKLVTNSQNEVITDYLAGSYWTKDIAKAILYGDQKECQRVVNDHRVGYKYYEGHTFVVVSVMVLLSPDSEA